MGAATRARRSTVPDDTELLEQIGRGDQAAFKSLLDRHARYLYGVAHALSGDAVEAEDLVQEALIGALNGKFRGESSVRTWLVRILINRVRMWRRSRRKHEGTVRLEAAHVDEPALPASAGSGSTATAVDAKIDLTAMLEQLTPEHRQVIVLRELQGLSYEEMAKTLGVPRGTVESRLHRAREELRKRFKGYW
jgi:RNA polymerase sigma-70 factor, ECF subfamily